MVDPDLEISESGEITPTDFEVKYTHRIHGTGIFTHIYYKNQPFM